MFRRSASRFETRNAVTKSEGIAVCDHYAAPNTPNHSVSISSDTHNMLCNANGSCVSQVHSPSSTDAISTDGIDVVEKNQHCSPTDSAGRLLHTIETVLLRYPHDPGWLSGQPVHGRSQCIRVATADCKRIYRQYFTLRSARIPDKVKLSLSSHTFNNWLHSDAQLIHYLKFMFLDLDLPHLCQFPVDTLETWLLAVYRRYNNVPFHNFKHAFMVTQMMYSLIKQLNLTSCLPSLDLLVLLFSALSHDLDHPGFTNSYQVNRRSWLALRYNDISPLENHHCAVAFDLVSIPATNILVGLSADEYQWFRKAVIRCILATDMATHKDCVDQFRAVVPKLISSDEQLSSTIEGLCVLEDEESRSSTWMDKLRSKLADDPDSRLILLLILLKTCDISNEVRPTPVADSWLDSLLNEFFAQARTEKQLGLPVLPHMDPDKVTRAGSQIGFIKHLLVPLLRDLAVLFPQIKRLESSANERICHFQRMEGETRDCAQENQSDACTSSPDKSAPPKMMSPFDDKVELLQAARSCTLETFEQPNADPVADRVGKIRCLSTPVRPEFVVSKDVYVAAECVLGKSSQTDIPRARINRYSTGTICGSMHGWMTSDAVGSKRHHSQHSPPSGAALFPRDLTQLELSTKRDAESLLADTVVVVTPVTQSTATSPTVSAVVTRKSSTGSMVAALN